MYACQRRARECVIMSVRYEVVFACFLRADIPEDTLDVLRWHLGQLADRPAGLGADDHPDRLLCPNPASGLPGGDIASLQHQVRRSGAGRDIPAWGLFSRTLWPEDAMTQMTTIIEVLAAHVADSGYGGYYREEDAAEATAFAFAAPAPAAGV